MKAKKQGIKATSFLLLLLPFLLMACVETDETIESHKQMVDLSQDEYISIAFDNPKEISENQALDLVKDFIVTSMPRALATSPSVVNKYYISTTSPTRSSLKENRPVPVYNISLNNGKDGGFAIVSGDERSPCVIVFSEQGSIEDTLFNKSASQMIQAAKSSLLNNIDKIEYVRDALRDNTLKKIKKELGVKNITFDDVRDYITVENKPVSRATAVQYPSGKLWKEVKPLIQTNWNQTSPYNNALETAKDPTVLGFGYGGKNAVGCTGVAVAQIVAYYQPFQEVYGKYLDWKKLLEYPRISQYSSDESIRAQVAELCKYVAKGINTEWDDGGHGSSNMKKAYNFLNSIGIIFEAGNKYSGYGMDAARVIESLDYGYPVLITGNAEAGTRSTNRESGHCWILDGFQMLKRPVLTRAVVKANDVYVHANFGWGGSEDGYYMVDRNTTKLTFETNFNGNYNQNLRVYSHVRKK